MPRRNWPKTREEWQTAVDAAYACELIDSARLYGLITGGPVVNVERCHEILTVARTRHNITPSPDAVERFLMELKQEEDKPDAVS